MLNKKTGDYQIHIDKGELISFGRGEIFLKCIRGTLWVTWPGSGDVILCDGDEVSASHHGKLCVTSLTGALVQIRRKTIPPFLKEIPRLTVFKLFKSAAHFGRDEDAQSAFGDSVHSITR